MPEKMRHFESFSYTVGQKYPSNYVSGLYVALNDVIGCSQIHQNASLAFIATDYYTAYHSNYNGCFKWKRLKGQTSQCSKITEKVSFNC